MSTANSWSEQQQQFLDAILQAIEEKDFIRLVLSQFATRSDELQKVTVRSIVLQQQLQLSVLYRYPRQDITKNYPLSEAITCLSELLLQAKQANLFCQHKDLQLKKTKKSWQLTQQLKSAQHTEVAAIPPQHDRRKKRYVDQNSPFLKYLGVCDAEGQVIPSMARKWKQINKFVEIFANAWQQLDFSQQLDSSQADSSQPDSSPLNSLQQRLHVVDFGSGKGYLTFALYDYLQQQHALAQAPQAVVTGLELNAQMVEFCQKAAQACHFEQLKFYQDDVRRYQPEALDVMIALHACDIATDFAIHSGIRLNAAMIMCAPCCHKELRPQLRSPAVLQPMLQYGLHAGQQAEMLTDTIRALLLNAYGYECKVFEFVALEHSSKNKMILATKRKSPPQPDAKILAEIAALKKMYGIQQHSLELLLNDQWQAHDIGKKC
ncbi:class I SAM-dependent methyltransferase [Acinetobacter larvae]|uniref:Methyltransferase n=1 Tax=Acinetobacter larvae TaxID=1789224 RepID=A0A1B2M229_9GAMM|nr:SAM-dependent methyltransferase [Acinetobacter larvae]AOA59242.1 methyltransferase [Acinetobacter larvae]